MTATKRCSCKRATSSSICSSRPKNKSAWLGSKGRSPGNGLLVREGGSMAETSATHAEDVGTRVSSRPAEKLRTVRRPSRVDFCKSLSHPALVHRGRWLQPDDDCRCGACAP